MATTKKRFFGIFGKVFLYTMLILLIVVGGMFAFFSTQIKSAVSLTQERQTTESFRPLLEQLQGKSEEEITEFARKFHEENRSLEFCFQNTDGDIPFQTEKFEMPQNFEISTETHGKVIIADEHFSFISTGGDSARTIFLSVGNGVRLYATMPFTSSTIYDEMLPKAAWTFVIIFLLSSLSAAFFAWRIAKPVKLLAADTRKMAMLQDVSALRPRRDEIGQLAEDVHYMYGELKGAIHRAETEINHVKEMEETQRYFFSAASHELKTPVASALILLQGMRDNIGEYKDHPKYLSECIKKMNMQSKIIAEILEIVRLSDGRVRAKPEATGLSSLISPIVLNVQPLAEAREQSITVAVPETLRCHVDKAMFSRVLSNVIMNAVQNTPEHGEVRVWTAEDATTVRLNILNTDVQIDEKMKHKLFEPFYRIDKARSKRDDRSGLGLTIVKKSLDYMGIPFDLENNEQGVLFWMELPYKAD